MRIFVAAAAGAALLTGLAAGAADAMPVAPRDAVAQPAAPTLVRDGCGPGRFRTPMGYCRPFGWRRGPGFYGPPRIYGGPVYGGRRCFIRETYDGPRRICRW